MTAPPIRTVRDQKLSLWQSAVAATVRQELAGDGQNVPNHAVRAHPMMRAASDHVYADHNNHSLAAPMVRADTSDEESAHTPAVSKLHFEMAEAKRSNDTEKLAMLEEVCRQYATCDVAGWATCGATYLSYIAQQYSQPVYYDWGRQLLQGQQNINYGVIDYQLPNDAKVAVLGDWGTGMEDAKALLAQDHDPTPANGHYPPGRHLLFRYTGRMPAELYSRVRRRVCQYGARAHFHHPR